MTKQEKLELEARENLKHIANRSSDLVSELRFVSRVLAKIEYRLDRPGFVARVLNPPPPRAALWVAAIAAVTSFMVHVVVEVLR